MPQKAMNVADLERSKCWSLNELYKESSFCHKLRVRVLQLRVTLAVFLTPMVDSFGSEQLKVSSPQMV